MADLTLVVAGQIWKFPWKVDGKLHHFRVHYVNALDGSVTLKSKLMDPRYKTGTPVTIFTTIQTLLNNGQFIK